jgi:cell division protein FtsQ
MRNWVWPQFWTPKRRRRHPALEAIGKQRRNERRYLGVAARVQRPGWLHWLVRGLKRFGLGRVPWMRIAVVSASLALVVGLVLGSVELLRGDYLRVQTVQVEGAEVADAAAVARIADLDGHSLLTLDGAEAARRIVETFPEVKAASVHRDWPQAAVIELTEHQGWGYWQAGGRRSVIDADGLVLERGRAPADDAVTIFEIGAATALEPGMHADVDTVRTVAQLLEDARTDALGVVPTRFEFTQERGLVIRVEGGPDVVFGDSHNYAFKVAAWGALLDRIALERLEVREVDVRFGRELVLR